MCTNGLVIDLNEALYILAKHDRQLLIGRNCPERTDHNNVEYPKGQQVEISMLISGSKATCHSVSLATHTYVHNHRAEKKRLVELLRLREVASLPYSAYVVNGYLHHERCGWHGYQNLRYYTCLMFSSLPGETRYRFQAGQF